MDIGRYLPSARFATIVVSLLVATGLVYGAQYATRQPQGSLAPTQTQDENRDWAQELALIQAQAGIALPQSPAPETVEHILAEAASTNLTDTVARSLFITLTNAKAQGLGDDAPTQDELVAQALAQAGGAAPAAADRTAGDLTAVQQTPASLRAYGNGVMQALAAHPAADYDAVLLSVGSAVDHNNARELKPLDGAARAYDALAGALARVPVPQTLVPLHLKIINNIAGMAAAAREMLAMQGDPVRGLAALQRFAALGNETGRVFTTLAGVLNKNGILFSKEEPGSAWAAFLQQ